MAPIGFRILPFAAQPSAKLIAQLRKTATAHLSDNMHRLHAIGPDLFPCHRGGRMVGTALTVKISPGDNLMVHKAIDIVRPGDVVVVDAGGVCSQAIIGEIMSAIAERNGAAGMVIDGAIRDADALALSDFPVYARGITHRGPYKNGPGEINVPVVIGEAVVNPGDIIIGDDDGLLALPQDMAEETLKLARLQEKKESDMLKAIRGGKKVDRRWVDETLRGLGCNIPKKLRKN
ncbi:MAG: RraA family protein [Burkholderiales bacterium]|nr:RraA family protein [Burkholderiales bacterium]